MFIENNYARPLFDFEKGGPPSAFRCLLNTWNDKGQVPCGKVTRTERGMRMHLKTVHDWKEHPCLYSMDKPKAENEHPRKLRVFSKQNIEATIKRSSTKEEN